VTFSAATHDARFQKAHQFGESGSFRANDPSAGELIGILSETVSAFNTIDKIRLRQLSGSPIYFFDLIMHLTYLRKPQFTDIGWLKRAFQSSCP